MGKKIVTVVGARPQFVKAAVVSRAMSALGGLSEVIVHTGQHYDANMSDVFFTEMDIPRPTHALSIGGGTHGAMTGRMVEAVESILLAEHPDAVLVYGDTNSTLAGALAAVKLHIPLAHVEAGLRSWNRRMPEEINRVLTDHAANVLYCPTETAIANLKAEGIADGPAQHVARTGDVMYDAVLHYLKQAEAKSTILDELNMAGRDFVLATIHRAENTDDPERLAGIFLALRELAETLPVVLPLHPRTRKMLVQAGGDELTAGLTIIDPVGYFDMLTLTQACRLVATDSGGLQKEAFFMGKPCVTLRMETEWVELVESGVNRLALGRENIARALAEMLAREIPRDLYLYGRGQAGEAIAADLLAFLA